MGIWETFVSSPTHDLNPNNLVVIGYVDLALEHQEALSLLMRRQM